MRIAAGKFRGRNLAAPRGAATRPTGARVREALFEIMVFSESLRKLVLDGAPTQELRAAAIAEGMRPLRASGQLAILDGSTTVEEVLRETLVDN